VDSHEEIMHKYSLEIDGREDGATTLQTAHKQTHRIELLTAEHKILGPIFLLNNYPIP